MSCRKKSYGRFALVQMESDNCRKGASYEPVWKKDFSVSCPDLYRDAAIRNTCGPAAPCALGCGGSCGKTCSYAADERKPCGGRFTGRFPAIAGPCNQPVHQPGPCSFLKPCHDFFRRFRSDCGRPQPCGGEASGRFPFCNVNAGGSCCKPACERSCFN